MIKREERKLKLMNLKHHMKTKLLSRIKRKNILKLKMKSSKIWSKHNWTNKIYSKYSYYKM